MRAASASRVAEVAPALHRQLCSVNIQDSSPCGPSLYQRWREMGKSLVAAFGSSGFCSVVGYVLWKHQSAWEELESERWVKKPFSPCRMLLFLLGSLQHGFLCALASVMLTCDAAVHDLLPALPQRL